MTTQRTLDQIEDMGKSDGLMDEPKMTKAAIQQMNPDTGAYLVYLKGYQAGVQEDGR